MSFQPAARAPAFVSVTSVETPPTAPSAPAPSAPVPVGAGAPAPSAPAPSTPVPVGAGDDEALEFVRFCYRRRHVGWPALYDEMSVVAGRSLFRGMSYCELAEHGISFCLEDLPRMVALTERVVREDRPITEPLPTSISLSLAPAT